MNNIKRNDLNFGFKSEEEMNQNKIIKQQYLYKLTIKTATKENPIIVSFD